jgi:2-dehydropantoate 2-reductase
VQADKLTEKFGVVLLSCKAFDLEDAIKSFAPAVGQETAIIPMLNGMRHLDILDAKFGRERVLGGLCAIVVTLNDKREVIQLQPTQSLAFGERDGKLSERVRTIAASGKLGSVASEHIIQDMWEKWVFLASVAGSTCLMRGPIGSILAAPGGKDFLLGILDECAAVASAEGHPPRAPSLERTRGMLTADGSQITASMFRDIRAGAAVEADHVIGDLLARGDAAKVPVPKLRTAYTHLKVYEKQRG